jgi:cytidyltransferase-like protein
MEDNYMILDWSILDKEIVYEQLYKYNFYISSHSLNGVPFFERYKEILNISLTETENQIVEGKEVCDIEVIEDAREGISFQKCIFESLYNDLLSKTLKRKESKISIRENWGEVKDPITDAFMLWREFDKGYETVHVVNEDGEYIHSITKKEIVSKKLVLQNMEVNRVFVESNEDSTMKNLANAYLNAPMTDIPITKNGRINAVASCKVNAEINFRWKYIDQAVLDNFFARFPRIALSSSCGKLIDFYEMYKNHIDIEVLTENLLKHVDNYDVIITGCEGSEEISSNIVSISQVYLDLLSETIRRKFEKRNISYFYFQRPFDNEIENINRRWAYHDGRMTVPGSVYKNGYYQAKDYSSEECNIIDGKRLTVAAPIEFSNSIWCFGPCITVGINVNDGETMESQLQAIINNEFNNVRVVNWGQHGTGSGRRSDINSYHKMLDAVYQEGDIVIHIGENSWNGLCVQRKEQRYALANVLNKKPHLKCFVAGVAPHLNKEGYNLIANYIFDVIQEKLKEITTKVTENRHFRIFDINDLSQKMSGEVSDYLATIKKQIPRKCENKIIGSIVMNCNPFTNGHAYLIEESLKHVEVLYIFVVEEDISIFPFSERIEMVRNFCQQYNNVYVFPSGKCIGSSITFGEYFNKNALQDAVINPALDVMLFGKYIAPALNISIRFVGDEPIDNVTRQYNVALREKLPTYDVKLNIISRKKINGKIVSASTVRQLIKQQNIEEIRRQVPDSSMPYILNKINKMRNH